MKSFFACLLIAAGCCSVAGYENFNAAYNAGTAALRAGKNAEARTALAEAGKLATLAWQKNNAGVHEAIALERMKNFQEMIAVGEKILKIEKATPDMIASGWYFVGSGNQALKNEAAATDAFRKSFESGAFTWTASSSAIMLGAQLTKEKKVQEAEKIYLQLLDKPKYESYAKEVAIARLAQIALDAKDFAKASEYIAKGEAMKPRKNNFAPLLNMKTTILLNDKKVSEAKAELEKIVNAPGMDPSWVVHSYVRLGIIALEQEKDVKKADEYVKKSQAVKGASWGRAPWFEKRVQQALEKAGK